MQRDDFERQQRAQEDEEAPPRRRRRTTRWMVCPRCRGEGTIVNPSCSVWTQEDREEDPDGFAEMLAGTYDVPCTLCGGRRVASAEDVREFGVRARERAYARAEDGIAPDGQLWE